jgi:hypothetical protein
MCYYPDIETLEGIHSHGGMTQVVWVDDESSNFCIKEVLKANLDTPKPVENEALKRTRSIMSERRIGAYDLGAAGRARKERDK